MLASGWLLLLLLLLLLLQLVFIFVGILVESFSFFCAKIDNDRKLGNWKHRALLNTKILVNTKPLSDYEYRDIQIDIQIDEWIEKIG